MRQFLTGQFALRNLWQYLLIGLALVLGPAVLPAQELAEQLRRPFWMQGQQIRKVFGKAVREQRKWSVTIFSDDDAVALGTIVDADGWIVTKASQISQASLCEFADGRRRPFEYVGFSIKLDLALLKVDARDLTAVEWETQDPAIGEWMISVNPQELPLGVGVMSVPRRKIPRSDVRGVLGIQLEMTEEAIIDRVFPNSGAEAAGLGSGDLILKVNETPIRGRVHLIETIATFRPGDTVVVQVSREDQTVSLAATLTHPFGDFLSRIAFQEQMGGPLSFRRDDFEAVYQHDTVIKPEDCGGPVVNIDGKAVGINIARAGRTATYVLPANLILDELDDLKNGKYPPPIVNNQAALPQDGKSDDSTQSVPQNP